MYPRDRPAGTAGGGFDDTQGSRIRSPPNSNAAPSSQATSSKTLMPRHPRTFIKSSRKSPVFFPRSIFRYFLTNPSLSGRAKRLPARFPSTSRMTWGARKSRRIGPRYQDGELRRERRCDDNRYLKFSRDGYLDIVLGKIAAGTARASWWRTRFADHQLSGVRMRAAQILSSPDTSARSAFLAPRQCALTAQARP